MRQRSEGTTLIALYHFASGVISLLPILVLFGLLLIVGFAAGVSRDTGAEEATLVMGIIGLTVGVVCLLVAVANWIVGWGLWRQLEWARVAAIVLAAFRVFNVPLGTIIGGLIIWHLLRPEVRLEFAREAAVPAPKSRQDPEA